MYGNTLQGRNAEVEGFKVGNAWPMRRGSMTLFQRQLGFQITASRATTLTAVTHHTSHLLTSPHLSAKLAQLVAKLRYPHLSGSNMDFSDILYVPAVLELDEA
jgi:hypothetical protein